MSLATEQLERPPHPPLPKDRIEARLMGRWVVDDSGRWVLFRSVQVENGTYVTPTQFELVARPLQWIYLTGVALAAVAGVVVTRALDDSPMESVALFVVPFAVLIAACIVAEIHFRRVLSERENAPLRGTNIDPAWLDNGKAAWFAFGMGAFLGGLIGLGLGRDAGDWAFVLIVIGLHAEILRPTMLHHFGSKEGWRRLFLGVGIAFSGLLTTAVLAASVLITAFAFV